jgi:hypothetical protein
MMLFFHAETTRMHFCTFPRTDPPSAFVASIMEIFRNHEREIGTASLDKGLSSDRVMAILRADLEALGFKLEADKTASGKLKRPVFFWRGRSAVAAIRDRRIPPRMALRN